MLKLIRPIIALIFLMGSCLTQAIEVGDYLRIGEITTIKQQVIPANYWQNKYVLVEIWASWCPFCHAQNKNMQKLHLLTKDSNLAILAISVDRNFKNASNYIEKNQIEFPSAMMTPEISLQIGKRRGIPETYLLDPTGKVIQKDFGQMVDADFFEYEKYAKQKI